MRGSTLNVPLASFPHDTSELSGHAIARQDVMHMGLVADGLETHHNNRSPHRRFWSCRRFIPLEEVWPRPTVEPLLKVSKRYHRPSLSRRQEELHVSHPRFAMGVQEVAQFRNGHVISSLRPQTRRHSSPDHMATSAKRWQRWLMGLQISAEMTPSRIASTSSRGVVCNAGAMSPARSYSAG